jgi:polar amino acid transport system substrate-binding protein
MSQSLCRAPGTSAGKTGFGLVALVVLLVWPLASACTPATAPEPTPPTWSDPTWQRIERTGRLVVGISGDYPPFAYYNEQHRLDGFDVALIEAIGDRLGLRVEFIDVAFSGLGEALQLGQVDVAMAALSVSDEQEATLDFSDVYFAGSGVALAPQGSPIPRVRSAADLTPYRIGVQEGSLYQAEMQRLVAGGVMPGAHLRPYAAPAAGIADLREGAIDLFLMEEAAGQEFVAQGGVEIVGEGVLPQAFAIAIPEGAGKMQAELNRALRELSADGTLAVLSERMLGTRQDATVPLPTRTPGPTPTPSGACIEGMARIRDLSYDDDGMRNPPQVEKGEEFEKRWRLRNIGTCPWTEAYTLRFVHGTGLEAGMSGEPASIDGLVQPGQTTDVSVSLRTPQEPGIYRGFWQLFNDRGQALGETLWAGIAVPTETPTPTPTATPTPDGTNTPQPTWTPPPPAFVGPNWVLVLIRDESGTPVDPVPGSLITASFASDGTLTGSTGCNTYYGTYRAKESSIKVSDFSFTRLACPTDELNDQENRFLRFIEKATRFEVPGNQLRLQTGENLTLVFQAQ